MIRNRRSTKRTVARALLIGTAAGCLAGLYGLGATGAIAPVSAVTTLSTPAQLPVPPVPGTASGYGTPTSWDANGRPTHVTYSGPVAPPVTYVPMGGNSPLFDATGRPMVPALPSPASGAVVGGVTLPPPAVQTDPTHVTLNYIPAMTQQSPPPPNPLAYPSTPAQRQAAAQQAQLQNSQANGTFATAAGIGYSNGQYLVNGKTFTDRGAALDEQAHPTR